MLPGWTAHEVPLPGVILGTSPPERVRARSRFRVMSVAGFDLTTTVISALLRVSPLGEVNLVFGGAPLLRPFPDPVHGLVYYHAGDRILRYDEHGAALTPLDNSYSSPIAVSPEGDLYSLRWHPPVQTRLDLVRFDVASEEWTVVRTLSTFPSRPGRDGRPQCCSTTRGSSSSSPVTRMRSGWTAPRSSPWAVARACIPPRWDRVPFMGDSFVDPLRRDARPSTRFAAPSSSDLVCVGAGVTADGRVLFLSAKTPVGDGCSVVVFTRDVTPSVRRSWGAVKSTAH